ncbi:MAG: RDD family protein, partial [Pseudonocardiaceae bacterium]
MEPTDTERESEPTGMRPHPSGPFPVLAAEPVAALNPADPPEKSGQRSGQRWGRPTGLSSELAPPPQFGRPPRFAPPPQFGRPPPFVRQQAYHQADPGSPRNNGAQPALEAPGFETPGFETPGFETPGFETPGFETPGFETPGFETTVQQQWDGLAPSGQSDVDVPATEQVPGPLADFAARAISFLIDYVTPVIVLNILLSIGVASGNVVLRSVLTVVGYLGLCAFGLWNSGYLQGTTGQSVGRRVARTKLVKIETGRPIGFGRAL